ncbi:uncharacterized protein LOC130996091 [Salvia miltiorrhiza]|uniref:uncharacterized protein LOC130996091 n=1 Tax=Salvia miltiorrhiza TaxID=226208 RepID=UPI0025AD4706|nr:uncharacterized protein LOC130996091 [Salvia miltiorrhiza]
MVDFHISQIFQALGSQDNYLRIQNDTLDGVENSVDVATKENLHKLVTIAQEMLAKPVSRVDLRSGLTVPLPDGGTNQEALKRFAYLLSNERKVRVWKNNVEKKRAIPFGGCEALQHSWNTLVDFARAVSDETKVVFSKHAQILRPGSQFRINPTPIEKWNGGFSSVQKKLIMKSTFAPSPIFTPHFKLFCNSSLSSW